MVVPLPTISSTLCCRAAKKTLVPPVFQYKIVSSKSALLPDGHMLESLLLPYSCMSSKALLCLHSSSPIVCLPGRLTSVNSQAENTIPSYFSSLKKDSLLLLACDNIVSHRQQLSARVSKFRVINMSTSDVADVSKDFDVASEVVPGVIVGAGRVGQALAKIGGGKDIIVRRGESVPRGSTGPIYVCTRNDALDGVVESTPPERRDDLVFLQNGMIEPWLETKGLSSATQLLVYFAVAKVGEDPIDGKTDVNPEGLTAVTGKWADVVAARLHAAGLSCKVLPPDEFRASMLEKLIWISAFMLVGVRHPGATCGDVERMYNDEVVALIKELVAVSESEKGVTFSVGVVARLCAYARSVAQYPTAVKEFEWRNGWFYSLSRKAVSEGKDDPCPLHTSWLKEIGVVT